MEQERMAQFKISFTEGYPGCGCGCRDNDLEIASKNHRVSRGFYGTRKDAEKFVSDLTTRESSRTKYDFQIEEIERQKKIFVLYSGPSCVGKGPIRQAFKEYYPTLAARTGSLVLYTSRDQTAGEIDGVQYHFRKAKEIEEMVQQDPERYISGWIRGDEQLQALDLREAQSKIGQNDITLFEIYHEIGKKILNPEHISFLPRNTEVSTIFISPFSKKEIIDFKCAGIDIEKKVEETMLAKLSRRNREDKNSQEKRAEYAYRELKSAPDYSNVIVNRLGEDLPFWKFGPMAPEAKQAVDSFADIIRKGYSENPYAEDWRGFEV